MIYYDEIIKKEILNNFSVGVEVFELQEYKVPYCYSLRLIFGSSDDRYMIEHFRINSYMNFVNEFEIFFNRINVILKEEDLLDRNYRSNRIDDLLR